ncbi:polysaccharide deacetylase family protein [Methanolobus vulcani]|nr:polysaccharide deacetylase family protein [Methanolobus vulcani]
MHDKSLVNKSFTSHLLEIMAVICDYLGFTYFFRIIATFRRNKVAILMYHRVTNLSLLDNDNIVLPDVFEKQIQYLVRHYNVITFNEVVDFVSGKLQNIPRNSVILTFDDGYEDCYSIVYPILKKYNIPCTFFLSTDYIESNDFFWWDKISLMINKTKGDYYFSEFGQIPLNTQHEKIRAKYLLLNALKNMSNRDKEKVIKKLEQVLNFNTDDYSPCCLSRQEIKIMSQNGMDFGSHTCSHSLLTRIPLNEVDVEVSHSKKTIEDIIGKNVILFSYPGGTINDYNDSIKKSLYKNGYFLAVSTIYGLAKIYNNVNIYELPRLPVYYQTNFSLFKLQLTGIIDKLFMLRKLVKR